MNENLNLVEILKDCPKGTKLYSINYGDVKFEQINEGSRFPILVRANNNNVASFLANGKIYANYDGECALLPSKEQRDWSKFDAPWLKKERFDPNTLKPFDKVLVRDGRNEKWQCSLFSYINIIDDIYYPYVAITIGHKCCIPYNDDTKHLVGTTKEAPEFYRYWED